MSTDVTVYIVDDDQSSINSLEFLLKSVKYSVASYHTPHQFLKDYHDKEKGFTCLISDIRMPGMTGLELQDKLNQQGDSIPIIFITGYADVPMAIRAMKQGAVDFLEKPVNSQQLLEAINQCIQKRATLKTIGKIYNQSDCNVQLTPREKEVMYLIIDGLQTKTIADRLNISVHTAECHRARVMKKMNVKSVASLVKLILANHTDI